MSPRTLRALVVLILMSGSAVVAAPAQAEQTWSMDACVAGYPSAPVFSAYGNTTIADSCQGTGTLLASFFSPTDASVNGAGNGIRISLPNTVPNARIVSVTSDYSIAPHNGTADGLAFFTIDETNKFDNTPSGASGAADDFPNGPNPEYDRLSETQTTLSPSRSIAWAVDPTGSGATTTFDPTAFHADFRMHSVRLQLDDPAPPLAPRFQPTGLLDGGPQSGVKELTFDARDEDSGVDYVTVSSANTSVNVNPQNCDTGGASECPTTATLAAALDTRRMPNGPNTLTVKTVDVVGNTQITTTPTFIVDNEPAPTPTPVPVPTPVLNGHPIGTPRITSSAKATAAATPASIRTGWHHQVVLSGRVLNADGTPLVGATLDIDQTLAIRGAAPTKAASVTTGPGGAYRYTFAASASSTVAVQYPEHIGETDYLATRTVKVIVPAHVTLKRSSARHDGGAITLSGRVDTTPIPAGGAHVKIQYHSNSGAWLDAETLRTSPTGTFSWRHVFRAKGYYRLRAHVAADPHLAAAANNSPEITFTVR